MNQTLSLWLSYYIPGWMVIFLIIFELQWCMLCKYGMWS